MANRQAAYLAVHASGDLMRRVEMAAESLRDCRLCGWNCGIDRRSEVGPCRTGDELIIATAYRHFGEEGPIAAGGGSGAIFFSKCEMRCQFCQTARWNIRGQGSPVSLDRLAGVMLKLQDEGAANINLVTPTHVLPQFLRALLKAVERGLTRPLVWNSAGYDSLTALRLLEGIVDIYLPDMKYSDTSLGRRLSGVPDYPVANRQAVKEMARQVGALVIGQDGRAARGVLVRHLVMPGLGENTRGVLDWIADNLGPTTYLSLMDQYRPAYRAMARSDINRTLNNDEFQEAVDYAESLGLRRLDPHRILV